MANANSRCLPMKNTPCATEVQVGTPRDVATSVAGRRPRANHAGCGLALTFLMMSPLCSPPHELLGLYRATSHPHSGVVASYTPSVLADRDSCLFVDGAMIWDPDAEAAGRRTELPTHRVCPRAGGPTAAVHEGRLTTFFRQALGLTGN